MRESFLERRPPNNESLRERLIRQVGERRERSRVGDIGLDTTWSEIENLCEFIKEMFPASPTLVDFFREIKDIRRIEREADEILDATSELVPKFEVLRITPQSPDKHAEGLFVEDHLRFILMLIESIKKDKIRILDFSEVKSAVEAISDESERAYLTRALGEVESLICERPDFFVAVALFHDIAKTETIGFDSAPGSSGEALGFVKFEKIETKPKKMKPEEKAAYDARERVHNEKLFKVYRELIKKFSEEHQELMNSPKDFQKAFFNEYGISITYYGHAEEGTTLENEKIIRMALEGLDFEEEDIKLMLKIVEIHMEPLNFTKADAKQYGTFVLKLRDAGIPLGKFIRYLRAAVLLDLLGSKRPMPDGSQSSEVDSMIKFIISGMAHEIEAKKAAEKAAYQAAAKEVGLTSVWLQGEPFNLSGKVLGDVLRAVETAVMSGGDLMLSREAEKFRSELESKLQTIRERLGK